MVVLLLAFAISLVILNAMTYESKATNNIVVNISKRVIAETSALITRNLMEDKEVNDFPFTHSFGDDDIFDQKKTVPLAYVSSGTIRSVEVKDCPVSEYARNFGYEDMLAAKLGELRRRYGLDAVTGMAATEMDKMILLRSWVRKSIPRGVPRNVDYNFNALNILSRAEKGERFFCSEYSTVFAQCALSLGLVGRYVGLFKGHVVAEIWSNEFAKWVVMDVDNDLYYEKDGIPLNALDLHTIYETRKDEEMTALKGTRRERLSDEEKRNLLSYYHEFYVCMRNDWFSHRYPHWHHRANSIMNSLEWQDSFTRNNILVSRATRNKEEIYFPINTVSLKADASGLSKGMIRLFLDTFTPDFSHFLVRVDGAEPVLVTRSTYDWNLHSGTNIINVRAVNILGVKGPGSTAKIVFQGGAG